MNSTVHSNGRRAALSLVVLMTVAGPALAVLLPPGGAVAPPGSALPGGVIVYDNLIPYVIADAGGTEVFEGVVHDRVIRKPDGTHVFARRLRDTVVDSTGAVTTVLLTNFSGVSTDVDYDPFGAGLRVPGLVTRTADGSLLRFDFTGDPLFEPDESVWFYADTDALGFTISGGMTIVTANGESVDLVVASPVADDTPPEAEIISPAPFTCVCDPTVVTGIADDPDNTYSSHWLEYRAVNDPNWTLIGTSFTPVPSPGGTLFVWSTAALTQGYYFLRLTVENTAGLTTSVVTIVWVDHAFDNLSFTSPALNSVVGGLVCPSGTIDDHCAEQYRVEYMPQGGGALLPIDPGFPVYNGPKINQTFGTWDTVALGVADGGYTIEVTAFDDCGHVEIRTTDVIVDNTPPTAEITSPVNCECVDGIVQVFGTADDANLVSWVLQYSGGNQNNWVTIASGVTPVVNGSLGNWDTTLLLNCPHTLRLVVTDAAIINCNGAIHHVSTYHVTVNVGCEECPGDTNHDGVVDIADLLTVLGVWGLCP